ncbi:MAG: hypothetical protein O3B01_06455 [Planctomycetota bacterium]|nr:hypothetical protein [Planctomycetota bacterium]MDA1138206.1 hypothetical protein [Planctomycetota bacterium]
MSIDDLDLKQKIKSHIMSYPGRIDEMEVRSEEEVDELASELEDLIIREIKILLEQN